MAITYFGSASNPADNGAGVGATVAVTPPASMAAGDLVYVTETYRGAPGTGFAVNNDGGQAWTPLAQFSGTNFGARGFWCRFNGTWSADPSFTVTDSFSGSTATTVVMHVFRPSSSSKLWKEHVAQQTSTFVAGSTPFTKSRTGQTTTIDSTVSIATFGTGDDNTWGSITGSGWTVAGSAQYRNTSGNDTSVAFAYKIQTAAGATGTVTLDQLTLGGDAGASAIVTFAEYELFTSSLAGAITPTASLVRQVGKALAGAATPAGTLARSVGKSLAGVITPTGATAKLITRTFAGAITPAGALLKVVAVTLVGSVLVAGALVKMAGKALAGVVAPAGALVKTTAKLLAGIIEPIGTVTKRIALTLAGAIAPIGSLVKLVAKLFGGGVTPSGALEHSEFSTNFVAVTATVEERNRVRMTEIREDNAGTLVIEERERVMLAVEEED